VEGQHSAHGARLGTVVVFVPGLDRLVSFYLEGLGWKVADRSPARHAAHQR
jgi:hypothetical protein